MLRILTIISISISLIMLSSCGKTKNDPRSAYVGQWNFTQTIFSYSGYYVYTPDAQWYSNSSTQINYDDNTGSIELGSKKNELIIKYCATCDERVVNIDDMKSAEKLTHTQYEYVILGPPPSYSSSYTTNTITGQKL